MSQVEKIVKDGTSYGLSTIIAQFIGIFTSIALRRFLTPEMMGIWTAFLVVLNYALFAHLGVFTAIEVKIPYLRGKNENSELQNMRNTAFTFAVALSAAIALIILIFSLFLSGRFSAEVVMGIRILALIIVATLFYNLYISMLRADKKFSLLSKAIVFNAIATLISISAMAYFFKLRGVYFATLLATSASWFYIQFKTRYGLKLHFDLKLIKKLSKIGLPILLAGMVYIVLLSVDKIMIMKMLGPTQLGYYSIAVLAMTSAHNFPKLFGIVVFPSMQEEFGKSDSRERILKYVKKPSVVIAYTFPVMLAGVYFMLPVLVHYVLPKYTLGVDSMRMLLCGCFFISLVPLTHNFVIAISKQIFLIPITGAAVLSGIGMNYAMINMGYGITGVAFGTSVAYFIYFTAMFFYVSAHCEKWIDILGALSKICAPFIYSIVLVLLIQYSIKVKPLILGSMVQLTIFYFLYTPMLFYINKKTRVVSRVFHSVTKGYFRKDTMIPEVLGEEQI